jgi:hypothetical protein
LGCFRRKTPRAGFSVLPQDVFSGTESRLNGSAQGEGGPLPFFAAATKCF